jgi:hypothetical protein
MLPERGQTRASPCHLPDEVRQEVQQDASLLPNRRTTIQLSRCAPDKATGRSEVAPLGTRSGNTQWMHSSEFD